MRDLGLQTGYRPVVMGHASQGSEPALTPREESTPARSQLEGLSSRSPLQQVLWLHEMLLQHDAGHDPALAEALGSALLERALGHATGDASSAHAGKVGTSASEYEAQPTTREEQIRALRVKYGLEQAPTPGPVARWWGTLASTIGVSLQSHVRGLLKPLTKDREQARIVAREALIATWDKLPASVRGAALSTPGLTLGPACARVLAMPVEGDGAHHRSACAFILDLGDAGMAPLVVPMLDRRERGLGSRAEHALFALVWAQVAQRSPEWMTLALQGAARPVAQPGEGMRADDAPVAALLPGPAWAGWHTSLTHALRSEMQLDDTSSQSQARLAQALRAALDTLDRHGRRGVAFAVLAWCDAAQAPGGTATQSRSTPAWAQEIWRVLTDDAHPAQAMLAGVLRTSRWPLTRVRALQFLGLGQQVGISPRVLHAAVARISLAHGLHDHEAVLASGHLSLRPARRKALSRVVVRGLRTAQRADAQIGAPNGLPGLGDLTLLTPAARRMLPLWTGSIRMDAPARQRVLAGLLTDDDASARLTLAMRGLMSLRMDLLFDADVRVAHSALLHALADDEASRGTMHRRPAARVTKGPQDPATSERAQSHAARRMPELVTTLRLLERSPHALLRSAARREVQGTGDMFSSTAAGRLMALRALADDRTGLLGMVRERLAGDPQRVLPALALVRTLQIAPEVEEPLLRLAIQQQAGRARSAATAVTLLGACGSDAARRVLTACLSHPDGRVRANAVEALGRLALRTTGLARRSTMLELKRDKHHRVRATAVRADLLHAVLGVRMGDAVAQLRDVKPLEDPDALLDTGTWREDVTALLTHDDAQHRLAGVWLASRTLALVQHRVARMAWVEVSQRVAEMASFDDDPRVRRRAVACASLAEGTLRYRWQVEGSSP